MFRRRSGHKKSSEEIWQMKVRGHPGCSEGSMTSMRAVTHLTYLVSQAHSFSHTCILSSAASPSPRTGTQAASWLGICICWVWRWWETDMGFSSFLLPPLALRCSRLSLVVSVCSHRLQMHIQLFFLTTSPAISHQLYRCR